MDRDVSGNRLLSALSRGYVTSFFQTDDYRDSPVPDNAGIPNQDSAPATPITLADYLAQKLAIPLQRALNEQKLHLNPALVRGLLEHRKHRSTLAVLAEDIAKELYLYQLHADLIDETSARHQQAQVELLAHAREHLERGAFYGEKTAGFYVLLEYAEQTGREPDDLYAEFWEKRIWPKIVRGRYALSHPLKLHGYLRGRANGFISHKVRDFRKEIERNKLLEAEGQGDDATDVRSGRVRPEDPSIMPISGASGTSTEDAALENIETESMVRWIMTCVVAAYNRNPLGFLIYLFRQVMMPNVSGINKQISGSNQQIASVLEIWRSDQSHLVQYLKDSTHGLGFDDDVVDLIVTAVWPGFANAPIPITTEFVTTLLNRFIADLRRQLREKNKGLSGRSPNASDSVLSKDSSAEGGEGSTDADDEPEDASHG